MVEVTDSFATKLASLLGVKNDDGWFTGFLRQWQRYEGGTASYNPLNTTQRITGSYNYNDIGGGMGVQHYPDEDTGVMATYQTLINGYYPDLLQTLQTRQVTPGTAANISKWGTHGFANALSGGEVPSSFVMEDDPASYDPDDFSQEAEQIREVLNGLILNAPELDDYEDPEAWTEAMSFWKDSIGGISDTYKTLKGSAEGWAELPDGTVIALADATPEQRIAIRTSNENLYRSALNDFNLTEYDLRSKATQDERDRIQDEFDNKMESYRADIEFDGLNLTKASEEISRFLQGKQESRARAEMIQDQKDMEREWGTTGGKTSFTGTELGGAISKLMQLSGVDPNSTAIRYPGYTTLDVEGDLAKLDADLGVTGQIPQVPSLITNPASKPAPPSLPAGPSAPSLFTPQKFNASAYTSSTTPGAKPTVQSKVPGVISPSLFAGIAPPVEKTPSAVLLSEFEQRRLLNR